MNGSLMIAFWALMFIGSHLVVSSEPVRSALIERLGEMPFRGIYSLIALATFLPLTFVFADHKHAGPMLWYLRDVGPVRWLAWLMLLAAVIIVTAGLTNPNPGAIGAPGMRAPSGMLKITRHPSFVGIALFGIAHLLMNGWLGDVFFFATFPVLSVIGGIHQDLRKVREIGQPYREFIAGTSFFPGAALWSGRQRWARGDMPWAAVGLGAAATIIIVMVHPMIFGGSPLG